MLDSRVREAARMYATIQGNQKIMIASGGCNVDETSVSEAAYMKDSLVKTHGVPKERVFQEKRSANTVENVVKSLVLCRRLNGAPICWSNNGWVAKPEVLGRLQKMTFVTSDFHAARVRRICEFFSLGDLCDWKVVGVESSAGDGMAAKELNITRGYTAEFLNEQKAIVRAEIKSWPCS